MAKKRKSTDIPPGLIPMVAATMEQHIRKCLSDAKRKLPSYAHVARIAMTDDYVIDAEITVDVPRGTPAKDVLIDLDEACRPFPTTVPYQLDGETFASPPTWVSTGVKVPLRPLEVVSGLYAIHKRGITHAGSYYRRGTSVGTAFNTGKTIIKNFDKAGRRKPESVFLRIHWNPYDTKPTREG